MRADTIDIRTHFVPEDVIGEAKRHGKTLGVDVVSAYLKNLYLLVYDVVFLHRMSFDNPINPGGFESLGMDLPPRESSWRFSIRLGVLYGQTIHGQILTRPNLTEVTHGKVKTYRVHIEGAEAA